MHAGHVTSQVGTPMGVGNMAWAKECVKKGTSVRSVAPIPWACGQRDSTTDATSFGLTSRRYGISMNLIISLSLKTSGNHTQAMMLD